MSDFWLAVAGLSESPLLRFLAAVAVMVVVAQLIIRYIARKEH